MKEATGEVSMTVIVIVAVAVIGGILAAMWPTIKNTITNTWGNTGESACTANPKCTWTPSENDEGGICNCNFN